MFHRRITPSVTAPLEDEPLSRRRLRGRQRVLVGLGVILLLVGLRLWWGWRAQRQLDRAIAELRASGEPVTEQDLPSPVPDEQNAAFYLRRAAAAYRITRPQEEDEMRDGFYLVPLSPEAVASIGQLLEDNRRALADVRTARGKRVASWGPVPASFRFEDWTGLSRDLGRQRTLAQLLEYGVRHAHATGNDAEAVERLLDILAISRAMEQYGHLTSHLVAVGIAAIAAEEIQPTLPSPPFLPVPPGVSREQLKALIAELLDEREMKAGLGRAIRGQRPLFLAVGTAYDFRHYASRRDSSPYDYGLESSPGWLNASVTAVARPLAVIEASRWLQQSAHDSRVAEVIDPAEAFPAVAFATPPAMPKTELFGVDYATHNLGPPQLGRLPTLHRDVMVRRTDAAYALAVRLFQVDHGRKPAVAELAPGYLPFLPPYLTTPPATAPATRPAAPPATGPTVP